MEFRVDQIPVETKWAMAARGLTAALAAHLNTLYGLVGKEQYTEMIGKIWAQIGQGAAEELRTSSVVADNAASVSEAGAMVCMCVMGPEYKIEAVEASADRTIMKITACPWLNRLNEAGISHDLLSACDVAFWKHFVKALAPNVIMRHGKQMHLGDPYCEWIFETRKDTKI